MLLAIDTGNTNTLFAVHDGKEWRAQWRSSTDMTKTADDYAVWLSTLMEINGLNLNQIDDCMGAHGSYTGALIVIDSGTATTFDIVSEDGSFEGGIIAPGINLSMKALHEAAAKLPRVAIQKPDQVIGKDTVAAMQSGVFWGYIDLIDGLVERIKAEYGRPMTVIATGGVASLFEGAARKIDHFDSDITIKGLRILYDRNITNAAKEIK
ncbi:MAG: pantothenate kinase [Alphaproteobacteria bacterium 32-64-14]|nr:MAG: pantothenate kinase [Alphaproteobacteria bacterium 32-64-14]